MNALRMSEAQLEELKARNPCDQVAARWVTLRKAGSKMVGPCPIHSPDPHARDSTSFECTAEGWVCATCCDGGDVIRLVQRVDNCDFLAAVDLLGGKRELDPAEVARAEAARAEQRAARERENQAYRDRERRHLFKMWTEAAPIAGTPAEEYLALRGLKVPPRAQLRFDAQCPLFANGSIGAAVVHRGPAMFACITRPDGKFGGLHITWIDLARPKGKAEIRDPLDHSILPSRKVRGSKTGGRIELAPRNAPRRLIIGEGIETVLSVYLALDHAGRDLSETAFWSAVDLGNLGGKHQELVPHPFLKTETGRAQRVPGYNPDLSAAGIPIPESVDEIVLLGDSDSDRFTTECVIYRAAQRYAREGRTIKAAWAPPGRDFNDLILAN